MNGKSRNTSGFTLVELLVVIGIIAVLISILLPALSKVREQAKRADCASRLRQLTAAVHLYANENRSKIPPGYRDKPEEHTIWMSQLVLDSFLKNVKSYRIFSCPNLEDTQPNKPTTGEGWVLGYSYLGGREALRRAIENGPTPADWKSALKLGEKGQNGQQLAIFADFNDWSPTDKWTAVAHPLRGAGGFWMNTGGATPAQRNSIGGNVAYIDGSVQWRGIKEMVESSPVGYTGHQTYSGSATKYRGLW